MCPEEDWILSFVGGVYPWIEFTNTINQFKPTFEEISAFVYSWIRSVCRKWEGNFASCVTDSSAESFLVHRQSPHTVTVPFPVHRQSQHTVTVPFAVHRQSQHTVTVPFAVQSKHTSLFTICCTADRITTSWLILSLLKIFIDLKCEFPYKISTQFWTNTLRHPMDMVPTCVCYNCAR
jgi:hypothetical protein